MISKAKSDAWLDLTQVSKEEARSYQGSIPTIFASCKAEKLSKTEQAKISAQYGLRLAKASG